MGLKLPRPYRLAAQERYATRHAVARDERHADVWRPACGARLMFERHQLLRPEATRIPLDVEIGPGNILIDDARVARVVRDGEGTRRSHFASCPQAGKHRRGRA